MNDCIHIQSSTGDMRSETKFTSNSKKQVNSHIAWSQRHEKCIDFNSTQTVKNLMKFRWHVIQKVDQVSVVSQIVSLFDETFKFCSCIVDVKNFIQIDVEIDS